MIMRVVFASEFEATKLVGAPSADVKIGGGGLCAPVLDGCRLKIAHDPAPTFNTASRKKSALVSNFPVISAIGLQVSAMGTSARASFGGVTETART